MRDFISVFEPDRLILSFPTVYLVLPERPADTDGWSEEQLATLVTRNSMIGVERAKSPH